MENNNSKQPKELTDGIVQAMKEIKTKSAEYLPIAKYQILKEKVIDRIDHVLNTDWEPCEVCHSELGHLPNCKNSSLTPTI